MKRKNKRKKEPTLAPGIFDHEKLEQRATEDEKARGDYTQVVELSFDEVEPSPDPEQS